MVSLPAALSLFYIAILLHPVVETLPAPQAKQPDSSNSSEPFLFVFGVPPTVSAPIFGSLLSIFAIPTMLETSYYTFSIVILLHALLFVPFISVALAPKSHDQMITRTAARKLYTTIGLLAIAIRLQTFLLPIMRACAGHWTSPSELFNLYITSKKGIISANSGQVRAGLDVPWVGLSWTVWRFVAPGGNKSWGWSWNGFDNFTTAAANPILLAYFFSLAFAAPLYPAGDEL